MELGLSRETELLHAYIFAHVYVMFMYLFIQMCRETHSAAVGFMCPTSAVQQTELSDWSFCVEVMRSLHLGLQLTGQGPPTL